MKKILHQYYIRAIAQVIWLNEQWFFYPKLEAFYAKQFSKETGIVILDIGANRGQSIRFFRSLFPKAIVHAFEPNPRLFAGMKRRFRSQGIHLHQLGISSKTGSMTFYENVLDETSGFEKVQHNSAYAKTKSKVLLVKHERLTNKIYPVAVTSIDAFLQTTEIGTIAIMKMDVEGHEWDALQGASATIAAKRIDFIQLEEHADDQYAHAANNISLMLQEFGYTECFRLKHGFGNFYEVVYARSGS